MAISYVGARTPMRIDDWLALGWSRVDAKRFAAEGAAQDTRVLKITKDGVEALRHTKRHSPSGLEWGYGGSGPADLALSILCDHLDLEVDDDVWGSGLRERRTQRPVERQLHTKSSSSR